VEPPEGIQFRFLRSSYGCSTLIFTSDRTMTTDLLPIVVHHSTAAEAIDEMAGVPRFR
jgi:hypothetical protein